MPVQDCTWSFQKVAPADNKVGSTKKVFSLPHLKGDARHETSATTMMFEIIDIRMRKYQVNAIGCKVHGIQ